MKIKIHPQGNIHVNEIKICPNCKGTGRKVEADEKGREDKECHICRGSGRIKITGVLQSAPYTEESHH